MASTALVPLLSFGIPGSNSAAILLGGLLIHGLLPGPRLFEENADTVIGLYTGLFVATLSLLAIGTLVLPVCLWLVNRSRALLTAFIYALILSGIYTINASLFDVGIVLAAGAAGYLMRLFGLPLLPAVLGVVLGFLVESNYRRSLVLSGGDLAVFLEDPIAVGLLVVAVLFIAGSFGNAPVADRPARRRGRAVSRGRSEPSVAETLACWLADLELDDIPPAVRTAGADTVIDTLGLAFAARRSSYVAALMDSWTADGPCTVIGSRATREAGAAAMINGTAAHGEDFDNTYEGCPVHPGAVVVPAVLAAAEAHGLTGNDAMRGIAVGQELMCRLGLTVQKGVHAAGFHPTAVIGAMGAAAAVAAATRSPADTALNALGIAGSMASGIIEYPDRRLLDQAHARRLGCTVGSQGRGDGAGRVPRTGNGVRRTAWLLPRVRPVGRTGSWSGHGGARRALGVRPHRLQALCLRHDDTALCRLRHPAGKPRHRSFGHRGTQVFRRRRHRPSPLGTA